MNNVSSLSRYILVILCVAIVFTALILIVLNSIVQNKRLSGLKSGIPAIDQIMAGQTFDDGYKAGFIAARSKCSPALIDPTLMPLFSLAGAVESVSADKVVFTVSNLYTDELVDGIPSRRTAIITTSTKITAQYMLPAEEFSKLLTEAARKGRFDKMPLPYTEKTVKATDLKPGQGVQISAKTDIANKGEFQATEIVAIVQPEPAKE